jgi:hypothetical protein
MHERDRYKRLEEEANRAIKAAANRAVVEFSNRLTPFGPDKERRTVLDISPGDCHNARYCLLLGYYVVALKDKKADAEMLQSLPRLCEAYNEYEKIRATQEKRPINPKWTRECEIVDRLPNRQFDGILAIHALVDLSPTQLRYLSDYISEHTRPKGYLALTTRTTQQNPFPKWHNIPDWKTQYTGRDEKRKTETLNLAMVIERLLRRPRK